MTNTKLVFALIVGLAFSFNASAKLYKWVDDKGITHYGETIPPEYADKSRSELNKAGRAIKTEEVLTPAERAARDEAEKQKRVDTETLLEQRRRDRALLNTYSNPDEIDLARQRNMQQMDARVTSKESQLKIVNDRLQSLEKEAAGYQSQGRKLPVSLSDDMTETRSRQEKLQADFEKAKAERDAMSARFDADKARYKELTGK